MGRWKPPRPESSPYITPQGYARLQKELETLWAKRAEVTTAVTAAAAEGDRSENAEYIYRKKQLREIDHRIHYLQKRLPNVKVVGEVGNTDRVLFGAWVTLEREAGEDLVYRLVGADEIGTHRQYISVDSPMARAMLKKSVGDQFSLSIRGDTTHYVINNIHYAEEN